MKTNASRIAFVGSFILAGCGPAFQAAPDTADADTSGTGGGGGTGGSSAGIGGEGGAAGVAGSAATGGSAGSGDAGANDAGVNGLTVTLAGNGTGTVTSTPTGINCPGDCSEAYMRGQMITLTAAASTGSTFTGWSGGGCTVTGICVVPISAATTVTATFSHSLTCTTVSNALNCIDSTIAEINLGQLGAAVCHDKCQISMVAAGMTSGCWVLASDMNCYCRSGVLNPGGTFLGGTCN